MKKSFLVLCCLLWVAYPVFQAHGAERVGPPDLYRAMKLRLFEAERDLAQHKLGQAWDFQDGTRENFTHFSPEVKDLQVADGVLRFKASGKSVTLGWGNYQGQQPPEKRVNLWPWWNKIELRVKQSAEASTWTLSLWQDGKQKVPSMPRAKSTKTEELKGTEWQTLSFFVELVSPDGFEIKIAGPAGNLIEIDSLRVLQKKRQGYFRRGFTLPTGKVWRAVAEVGQYMRLYVNGQEVVFQPYNSVFYSLTPVNLAPYLKPGQNCIAMCANDKPLRYIGHFMSTQDPPWGYLQGTVVMSGGEVITLDTGTEGWKVSETPQDGWTKPGFDDTPWKMAENEPKYHNDRDEFTRRLPAYDGRLVLENPHQDPKLFFSDAQPLHVNVRVPEGLAKEQPVLQWILRRAAQEVSADAPEEEVTRGTVEKFAPDRKQASLVYQVDAGLQKRGVYTLEVSLHVGDSLIEKRLREPLAVVGKIPMPEVKGTNYEEGMKLVLEDTIDFTNPKDSHLWVEAEKLEGGKPAQGVETPRIVRKDGLAYRETGTGVGAGVTAHFSYQFAFKQPGSFYLMVLEYPDDADRCIGVSVEALDVWGSKDPKIVRQNQSGPAVITGFKYPLTGKMRELRWLHHAYSQEQVVNVASLAKDQRAAARRLRIYRVEELPALKVNRSGERWLGLHTERARTVARLFGTDDPGPYQGVYHNKLKLDLIQHATQRLKWFLEGCENYARYLRFTGQNLHVMGAFQYDEHNLSYFPPVMIPSARIDHMDIREVALRVFEQNGIAMISMVEYCVHKRLAADFPVSDAQVAQGADTVFPVSQEGKQAGGAGCVSQANFDHPAVQEAYLQVIDDLARKFSFSPAWKGVYLLTFPTFAGPVTYAPRNAPFDYDYSDATIAAFQKDTGIKIPVNAQDPQRFQKRYIFLNSEVMRDKWIDWRCQAVKQLVIKSRDLLQKYRKDLQLMYGYDLSGVHIADWCKSGRPYLKFLRDYGWDPSLFNKEQGIWCGRYFFPNDLGALFGTYMYAALWEHYVGKEPIAAYDRPENRLVVMNTVWHEVDLVAPGVAHIGGYEWKLDSDWPMPHIHVRYVSQPNNENALEKFTQAFIGADPEMVMYGFTDAMFPMGYEQELREFIQILTALPGEKFQPVGETCDFQHNLALRDLRKGKQYWFYVANPGYWPIKGKVVLKGSGRVVDPATDDAVRVRKQGGKTIVPIDLKPFAVVAFRVESPTAKVESWSNEPLSEANLKHMRGIIGRAERMMGMAEVAQAITLEERQLVRETIAKAKEDINKGEYAQAWSALTNWKFWTLVYEHLQQAAQYAARIPGYQPKVRTPDQIPALQVVRATQPPEIDGKLNDQAWKQAPFTEGFLSLGPQADFQGLPVVATAAQAAYDQQHLYLGFTMADPDIRTLKKTAAKPEDTLNAYDDTMVFFLHPNEVKVYQMAVNAAGLKYNADATGQTRYFREHHEDFGPWEAAATETDKVWMLEVAIPFATLKADSPKSGDRWRANFLRRFRKFLVPEMYWAQIKRTWYDTDLYGYLNFM